MKLPTILAWLPPASALLLAGVCRVPRAPNRAAPRARARARRRRARRRAASALGAPRLDPALGRYVAPLGEGRAVLTLDPHLQARLERRLADYRVPWGVTVLIEPATGRVLAMAEHSEAEPARAGLALAAIGPGRQHLQVVTAAALLEQGVRPEDEACYHGGKQRLQPRLPRRRPAARPPLPDASRDALGQAPTWCSPSWPGATSTRPRSAPTARRFLFNAEIPFPRTVEVSRAPIPDDRFELATTAAGFGPVRLSPLHGALIAAMVANGGVLVPPTMVDAAEGVAAPVPAAPRRVVPRSGAGALGEMMRPTVTDGTARRAFRRARARSATWRWQGRPAR